MRRADIDVPKQCRRHASAGAVAATAWHTVARTSAEIVSGTCAPIVSEPGLARSSSNLVGSPPSLWEQDWEHWEGLMAAHGPPPDAGITDRRRASTPRATRWWSFSVGRRG